MCYKGWKKYGERQFTIDDPRVQPEPNTGCWLWTGSLAGGYGMVWSRRGARAAHRHFYEARYGSIPGMADLLHSCDVPTCVNPDHLRPGDDRANQIDALTRGRQPRTVLSPALVRAARLRLATGEARIAIARSLGVNYYTLCNALNGKAWGWVGLARGGDDAED